ncbi:MAG TPA: NADH-quinone oxidoreductase subunit G [Alphaproteobacteria bacterium]|nr:NADH-quinone oxidoreductase subunit G [Alphaproteobacteria bacterium]
MVKLFVDDKEIEVTDGSTVMQACEKIGAEIPRFCFHERLSIAGNCRMCLVEVEGSPKPVASCAMPAVEGMKVITKSDKVKTAREGVMEFLLINHPLDCPICDQGGECDLQDQALFYGRGKTRFVEDKRAVDNKPFGPLIKTIMNRCIHCTRCVRFMDEIAGVHDLGAIGRGEDMEIISNSPKGLGGELSGNIIDLCPVGALTSAPYAFKARPWELTKTNSIDIFDGLGSAIEIGSKDGQVLRVLPRLNEDINEEWLADKSRFAIDGLSNQRLDSPYKRDLKGKLVACSWEEAFKVLAENFKGLKSEEIAALVGDQACLESIVSLKDLMTEFNVTNIDCRPLLSSLPTDTKNRSGWLFNPTISGIEKADSLLIIGSQPRYEAALLDARIRKSWIANGLKIARIGGGDNASYPIEELGNNVNVIEQIYKNKHSYNNILDKSNKPLFLIGENLLNRKDGEGILGRIREIAKKYNSFSDKWNGLAILHSSASRVGALEVGFVPGNKGFNTKDIIDGVASNHIKLLWLLGVDDINLNKKPNTFVVYQGHHGDKGAEIADLILPGSAYTEKDATYLNTEGRVQRTNAAVSPPGDAKEDWKIIRAFSAFVDKVLPYDNISELRKRLANINKLLVIENSLIKGSVTDIGDTSTKLAKNLITPKNINYFMTCPISRASETMAKCSIAKSSLAAK